MGLLLLVVRMNIILMHHFCLMYTSTRYAKFSLQLSIRLMGRTISINTHSLLDTVLTYARPICEKVCYSLAAPSPTSTSPIEPSKYTKHLQGILVPALPDSSNSGSLAIAKTHHTIPTPGLCQDSN